MNTSEPCHLVASLPYVGGRTLTHTKTIEVVSRINGRVIEALPNTESNRIKLVKKYPQVNNNYYI